MATEAGMATVHPSRMVFDLDPADARAAYRTGACARFVELGKQIAIELALESLAGYLQRFAEDDREMLVGVVVTQLFKAMRSEHGYGFEHVVRTGTRGYSCFAARAEDRVVVGVWPRSPTTLSLGPGDPGDAGDPSWRFPTWYVQPERNARAAAAWSRAPARVSDAVAFPIIRPSPQVRLASRPDDARGRELLAEVRARPDDDDARLVYADWLLDHGDVRGELIQLQCELARNQIRDPRRPALRARERALLSSFGAVMFRDLANTVSSFVVRRGLVDSITVRARVLAECGDALLDAHPIRHATVLVGPHSLAQLHTLQVLGRIASLTISWDSSRTHRSRTLDPLAFARAPIFAHTEELEFTGLRGPEDDLRTLVTALEAPQLRAIGLDINIGALGLFELARTSTLPLESVRLCWAGLVNSNRSATALRALAARPGLRCLGVRGMPFDSSSATNRVLTEMLARAHALTELEIADTRATDGTLLLLCEWLANHPLDRLELARNGTTLEGLVALIRAPGLANVATLVIDPKWIHDHEIDVLADALLEIPGPIRVHWSAADRLGPVRGARLLERVDLVRAQRDGSLDLVDFG